MCDVMGGAARWESRVQNHGFVALVDVMPRFVEGEPTVDNAIVQAARVSYGQGTKKVSEDRHLIRYLYRHSHTTPFEMVELKFHCRMPIFVARQWIRHRTASVNEYSARYSEVPDLFWEPEQWRVQSSINKQGSGGEVTYVPGSYSEMGGPEQVGMAHGSIEHVCFSEYQRRLKAGVSRELARTCLPVSAYTEWYWKIDLHNLFRFLGLRLDPHAQQEIRDYADPMYEMVKRLAPAATSAFDDYSPMRQAMQLSGPELQWMKTGKRPESIAEGGREEGDFITKLRRMGLMGEGQNNPQLAVDSIHHKA